jgi:hypothetical protein
MSVGSGFISALWLCPIGVVQRTVKTNRAFFACPQKGLAILGVFLAATLVGCSGTPPKVSLSSSIQTETGDVQLKDMRPPESTVYRRIGRNQYLGDDDFNISPVKAISERLEMAFGRQLLGKDISLVGFRAILPAHHALTSGLDPASARVVEDFSLPQLGNPRYAHVEIEGTFQGKTFTGAKSVSFYLGSGQAEIKEAFDAAVTDALAMLKKIVARDDDVDGRPQ